ncbi:uncharacterized protein Ecym_8150 [Eremothecium cymbalariae DBVPG|uniref:C3H1-type domain-containing protein n=1 Tax=Eremothecium cymbalariae (strain CBS 270.75 / DBVPG 7215 / KCTC 17166 / NRRL Y-17582) TaxID=931890 RepID=G8JX64_ERECY|nr:Hypothetical protein Ecym_8150 [Eremothecium cymbalariae DBVPG\
MLIFVSTPVYSRFKRDQIRASTCLTMKGINGMSIHYYDGSNGCFYVIVALNIFWLLTDLHSHFYYKIGACRHGDKCSKRHSRPINSQTIVIYNMYIPPNDINQVKLQAEDFDFFYEDVFLEAAKFGEVQEIIVCENKTDHLNGNVYIRFSTSDAAKAARDAFVTRWYGERPLYCDLSHVTDFREAVCKSYEEGKCGRGEQCNFIHRRRVDYSLANGLLLSQWKKRHISVPQKPNTGDTPGNTSPLLKSNPPAAAPPFS